MEVLILSPPPPPLLPVVADAEAYASLAWDAPPGPTTATGTEFPITVGGEMLPELLLPVIDNSARVVTSLLLFRIVFSGQLVVEPGGGGTGISMPVGPT